MNSFQAFTDGATCLEGHKRRFSENLREGENVT